MDKNDLLNQQLNGFIKELTEIEKELSTQLQLLGEKVDKGFLQLKSVNKNLSKITKEIINSFDEDDERKAGIELLATAVLSVVSGVAGGVTAIVEAVQHNSALNKLLVLKQEIAHEKIQSMVKIQSLVDRVVENIAKLIKKEALSQLSLSNIKNDILDMKLSIMGRTLLIYRNAKYSQLLIKYLCQEYQAWLVGKQYSDCERPTLLDANISTTDDLKSYLKEAGCEYDIASVFHPQNDKAFGAQIYLCTDPQLLSVAILDYGMSLSKVDIKKLPKLHKSLFSSFIRSNVAYKEYKKQYFIFNYWIKWFNGVVQVSLIMLIMIAIILSLFAWTDWAWWLEWGLGIAVLFLGGSITFGNYENLEEAYQGRKFRFYKNARNKMKSISGFVEIFRPDLDKKNLIVAGLKGTAEGFVSMFN